MEARITCTAMKFRLHTIADIWSKVGVLWGGQMDPKHPLRPLTGKLPKGGHESFQMRYYMTLYVKGLQNCGPSKIAPAGYRTRAGQRRSICYTKPRSNVSCRIMQGIFFDRQLWRSAVLQPFEIQGHVIPHWKGLITGCCLVTLLGAWQWFLGLPRPLKVPLLYFIYRRSYVV